METTVCPTVVFRGPAVTLAVPSALAEPLGDEIASNRPTRVLLRKVSGGGRGTVQRETIEDGRAVFPHLTAGGYDVFYLIGDPEESFESAPHRRILVETSPLALVPAAQTTDLDCGAIASTREAMRRSDRLPTGTTHESPREEPDPTAMEPLREAFRRNPSGASQANALAVACFLQGRPEEGCAALEHVARSSDEPVLYYNLGRCLWESGRREEAFDAFRTALSFDPDFGPALLESARCRLSAASIAIYPNEWPALLESLGRVVRRYGPDSNEGQWATAAAAALEFLRREEAMNAPDARRLLEAALPAHSPPVLVQQAAGAAPRQDPIHRPASRGRLAR